MLAFTLAIPVSFNATAGAGMSEFSYAMHVKHTVEHDAIYDFSYYSTYTETFPDSCSHHLFVASAVCGYSMRGAG